MTCQACGKPHPSVTVDRYGASALCTWCYLKRRDEGRRREQLQREEKPPA